MRKFTLLLIFALSLSFLGCGGKTAEKESIKTDDNSTPVAKTVEKKVRKLPEGFPEELTFPLDLARGMTSGSGTASGMGEERTFKSYSIWKSMPKNVPEIISHYKKLMTDLEYEGEWKGEEENNQYGTFKKGNNELVLKISNEQFKFALKIWDAEVGK